MISTQILQKEQYAEVETRVLAFYGNVNSHYLTNYMELHQEEQEQNENHINQDK
ncbi:hypothetical protein [Lysinibacillus fusiformis]|uniref:hypothetical protein n=1 Tax=Lysinibacillus fusiformis TaxID=28031 RepID=UPI00190F85B2|nr:hypothetical protein [Lysinibacillus fusiformis]